VPVAAGPGGDDPGGLPPGVSAAAMVITSPVETLRRVGAPGSNTPRPHTVSVFGDSTAWTMMRYLPATPGVEFLDRTTIGCGVVRGGPYRAIGQTLQQKPQCDNWPMSWSDRIAYDRPDVALLMIGRWEVVDRVNEGAWTHTGDPKFDAYLTGELQHAVQILGSTGARVVVTTLPYNRGGEQPDGSLYPEDQPERIDHWNTLLRRAVGKLPNVTVVDLNRKLCPGGGYAAKIDGIRLRSDGIHLTPDGVRWLTPWLEQSVR
jgi:hypothetical protein